MASWRGERSIAELCREHDISESLLRRWREQALEAGMERFAAGEQRSHGAEQRRRIAELERALGMETYELAAARPAREPQAGAARDARTAADPAPTAAGASTPAGVLPRRAPRPALASGQDLGLGRRARLGLSDGHDRLLHPRDHRLAPRDPLPRPRGDR